MSDHQTALNEADVLRELEAFAPQVKDGFARAGGPSDRVLAAIRAEAVRVAAGKRKASRLHVVFRRLAAAAVFAVLLAGSLQVYQQQQQQSAHRQAVALLRICSATDDGAGVVALDDTAALAQFLLMMQGLDQDTFFSAPDETEPLWL